MVFIFLDEANIPVLRKRKYFIGPCYTVIVFCSYSIVSVWKFFPGLHHNLGWDSSRLWLCLKQLAQVSIRGWFKRGTALSSRIESNLILLNEEENSPLFFRTCFCKQRIVTIFKKKKGFMLPQENWKSKTFLSWEIR